MFASLASSPSTHKSFSEQVTEINQLEWDKTPFYWKKKLQDGKLFRRAELLTVSFRRNSFHSFSPDPSESDPSSLSLSDKRVSQLLIYYFLEVLTLSLKIGEFFGFVIDKRLFLEVVGKHPSFTLGLTSLTLRTPKSEAHTRAAQWITGWL